MSMPGNLTVFIVKKLSYKRGIFPGTFSLYNPQVFIYILKFELIQEE